LIRKILRFSRLPIVSGSKVMALFDFSETEIQAKDRSEVTEVISDWKEGYREKTCLF